jgi:hypothetical protein
LILEFKTKARETGINERKKITSKNSIDSPYEKKCSNFDIDEGAILHKTLVCLAGG